jgi:glutamate formiminotransferase
MPDPIVECVPNFSEGRRMEVIEMILQAVQSVPDALVLDCDADSDHNRTVVTMAGPADSLEQAAYAAIAVAADRIDLRRHSGVHPRIGAADVVPFVPVRNAGMALCIALANRLGRRVGEELGLPVYLYGKAAVRSDRQSLAAIRRGEFEGLPAAMASDPGRKPDYGPARVGPAGATAIGARGPLIAFNIYLDSQEVELARSIARRIRSSSGGLPCLQALGLPVRGRAQVSMNLTDFTRTSLPDAYQAVRRAAGELGVRIAWSEIIGLLPAAAMAGISPADLQITDFSPEKILEQRLETALHAKSAQRHPSTRTEEESSGGHHPA